ncbi:MAG TPA: hypothetical protein VLW50_15115 [Streptosporangiaceae bacterium]|nr:hypothetical protein [Streptosporangiaceae bacterium]
MICSASAFGRFRSRYGKTATVHAAIVTCLWKGVVGPRPVQLVLVRERAEAGCDLALATTDLTESPAAVIERLRAAGPRRSRSRTPGRSSALGA